MRKRSGQADDEKLKEKCMCREVNSYTINCVSTTAMLQINGTLDFFKWCFITLPYSMTGACLI
jgi:hypothetical protein